MPKKKKIEEAPAVVTLTRKVIARGMEEDLCDLGPGVLYQDDITYTNDKPGPFNEDELKVRAVKDTQDLLSNLFSVEIDEKESE
jgi:hypothetical protein